MQHKLFMLFMKLKFCHALSNCYAFLGSKTTLIVHINKAQLDKSVIATKLV
jgi:hypothetical protein